VSIILGGRRNRLWRYESFRFRKCQTWRCPSSYGGKFGPIQNTWGYQCNPLWISTTDKEEIIKFVKAIESGFGAINKEDFESPKAFDIIKSLQSELSIPLVHDDQHGNAVIALAALINSLKLVKRTFEDLKVVISGAGSAGYWLFKSAGRKKIVVLDSKVAIYKGRNEFVEFDSNNSIKQEIANSTNRERKSGNSQDSIIDSDIYIGVSGKAGLLNKKIVNRMNWDAIVFALTNPEPEILPSDALDAGARIICTGRSDYPNQVNNAVVFQSVLRALLDTRSKALNEQMLVTASYAIASLVEDTHYVILNVNDSRNFPSNPVFKGCNSVSVRTNYGRKVTSSHLLKFLTEQPLNWSHALKNLWE
jgi:malate dehydrogenase (oxaloacetate-decarboxylating)